MSRPASNKHRLENQGSTCYLSSVLQVLFMTKDFGEAAGRLTSEKTEYIDLQLKTLFGDFKSRTAKTKDITEKLDIKDVRRRQKAAEYYKEILRLTSDDASKIFHGQLTHMTTCLCCGTKTGADRDFWHLPLALEGSSSQNFSVEKGIEEFFRASHFNGENQMYCYECDTKSDATAKCVINHHPEVLTLLLKRFEFDHDSNSYDKINCTVDVPCTLQIPENQTYELYAMVEHSGDLRSGHHIAKIKSEDDGRWYSFNDGCVTELDPQPFQSSKVKKRSSASLLFYRKAIKYHGLENQGSTCYLNSVLQVLFMTKDFRGAVERLPRENTEHIDLQLQSLFGDLKSRTAKTRDITKKLGIKDVYKQQDAAEYYKKILRLTSDDASKIFHGQLTHMTTCSSCDTKTGADGAFWHLPLALEDSSSQNFSVEKGIDTFFRASHFKGENQMYCYGCGAKSDGTTKCVIKHHPEVLTLLLKRFEFDNYNNRYVKINCTVDVPCTLQIPENQTYELYAMVEHSGDLRGGHYIATIKSEDNGRWYSFNDGWVTLLDPQPFQSDKVKKSSSASLLFYRKEKVPAAGTQVFREESTPGGSPLSTWERQDQSPAGRREREEDEGTAKENGDGGTGIKDKVRVKSSKPGLSSNISYVESNEDDTRGNAGTRTSGDTSPVESVSNMLSRPAIKYHGLENQGSTCYLSSVLQVLFMTKDFREAVERLPRGNTEHIDLQLQSLFGVLKSRTAETRNITKKLDIKDVSRQQDAAEYYEKILRLTSDDASKIFHGQLTHKTTCSSCGTKTGADRAFWHLPLALEGSSSQIFSVVKGIEEFFRASHFKGENQMYCHECRAKSDATKCVIKHHPEVLTLLLKRFEIDHYSKRCVQINSTVDVPCTLQIPENQTYELYAMVEHSGDFRSGHYIAKIKSEDDGRWYSFNDSWVTLLDPQPFQSDKVQKPSSAYLLFYRKVPAAGCSLPRTGGQLKGEREREEGKDGKKKRWFTKK